MLAVEYEYASEWEKNASGYTWNLWADTGQVGLDVRAYVPRGITKGKIPEGTAPGGNCQLQQFVLPNYIPTIKLGIISWLCRNGTAGGWDCFRCVYESLVAGLFQWITSGDTIVVLITVTITSDLTPALIYLAAKGIFPAHYETLTIN